MCTAAAAKAFAVLRAFDANLPDLTISEVAARTGLDRGTTFRLELPLSASFTGKKTKVATV